MQSLHDSSMKGQRLINQLISASMSQKEETNSTLQHLYNIGKDETNSTLQHLYDIGKEDTDQ